MAAPQSPLVGYNTNVRHHGSLYHIQTEDSGVNHPHVITHLFADGGRIIASRKTSYAEHVGAEDLATLVRKLMQEQHKAIFIELRDCVYDEAPDSADETEAHDPTAGHLDGTSGKSTAAPAPSSSVSKPRDGEPAGAPPAGTDAGTEQGVDLDALDRAADEKSAGAAATRGAGKYHHTVPAHPGANPSSAGGAAPVSIFGSQLVQGKSLDEVILSYLADDTDEV